MSITNNIGMLLLAIFLILWGINGVALGVAIPGVVLGILAIVSGIFILIRR